MPLLKLTQIRRAVCRSLDSLVTWGHHLNTAGGGVGVEPTQHVDLDFNFCHLVPKPLEGNSTPSSRKKPPLPLKEEPRKPPSLEPGTSRSLPNGGNGER